MIIGRVTFLVGKAVVISLDGSSRDLRLGDSIDSTETIEVSSGGEVVITDNNGVPVSIKGNESWVAENGQFNALPEVDVSAVDPTSVEAIQAALIEGIDPTTIAEETAAGNQGGDQQPGNEGSEGSSFVRVSRGNTSAIDSGLDFNTIAQNTDFLGGDVFDTLLASDLDVDAVPTVTPALTGFSAFDDVDSSGLAGPRELIANNSFTNDSTPIFSGSSIPGSIIRIYDNNELIASTTVDAEGNWEIQSPELDDEAHSITVTVQEEGSTESEPNGPLDFTVDTSAPEQTAVISNVYDDVNDVGDIASGGSTDDTSPQLQGALSQVLGDGEELNVLRDGVVIGQATVDDSDPANITWVFDDSGLVDGEEYVYQVQVIDAADNTGELSNEYTIAIDTSAPEQVVTIDQVVDNVGDVTGNLGSGASTDDTSPELQGSLSAPLAEGEVLNVIRDGVIIGQATIDSSNPADISWSYTDTALDDGEYNYTVQVEDSAGNAGVASDEFTLVIDTSAIEQAAVITNVFDDVNDVGDIANGGSTDDTAPQLQGTLTAALATGEELNVLRNGVVIGQATIDDNDPANVTWIFDDSDLVDGEEYVYQVQVVAEAGNVGELSNEYAINVDTSAPEQTAVITNVYDDVNDVGDVASGGVTDDTTPQLQGTLSAVLADGESMDVIRNGVVVGKATVVDADPNNITWFFDDRGLINGAQYNYQVQVVDAAGNRGELSNSYSIVIDNGAPVQSAVITNVYDNVGEEANVANGESTDDTAPQLQGTLTAALASAEKLNVIRDGVVIGQATVNNSDPDNVTWVFNDSGLVDGEEYSYQVQVIDAANNTGELSNEYSISIDSSGPEQTAIITNVYDDANDVGDVASGGSTDDTTPQLQGTLTTALTAGEELNVLRDGVVIGQAIVDDSDPANITWIFDDSGLVDGEEYVYQVQVIDASGNAGELSNEYTINIDTSAPEQTAIITNVYDDVNDIGDVASGGITDDTAPQLQGTLSDELATGEELNVLRDGIVIGQAIVDDSDPANITWIFDDSGLTNGEQYSYQVQVVDAAGNRGELSNSYSIVIDNGAPVQAAVITNVYDDVNDVGDIASGASTDDTAPQLQGTLSEVLGDGEELNVLRDGVVIGQAVIDDSDPANITWIFDDAGLVDGEEYVYQVQVIDAAGNTGELSNEYTIVIDTSGPEQTAIITNVYDDVNDIGDVASGGITDDTAPQLQGTLSDELAAGEELNVLRDGIVIGQAIVDDSDPANITWIFDDSGLTNGEQYSYQVQVVDAAGNRGELSNNYSIVIDNGAPVQAAVITNVYDDVNDIGDIASGASTDDTAPQLQGTLSEVLGDGEELNVLRDGVVIGQAVIDDSDPANITWIFDDTGLVDGEEYVYQVQVIDAAGNAGELSNEYTIAIDTSAPEQIATIDQVVDNEGDVTGDLASGASTDDTTPELQGSLSAPLIEGEVLNVIRDGVVVGQAVVDDSNPADISWSFTDSGLNDGEYNYIVQVEDSAGNTGVASDEFALVIDTEAPEQTAVITNVYDDVNEAGNVASGESTDDKAPQIQGRLSQILAEDEELNVLRDGVVIGQAVVDDSDTTNITWIFNDSGLVDGEEYLYQVQVVDEAGNTGELSNSYTIEIDSSSPGQLISIDSITDNVDPQQGEFGSGSSTNDTTPLINGSIEQALVADEHIEVYRDGVEIGVAVVDTTDPANITWSFLDDIAGDALEDGESYQYTARVVDSAGNSGEFSEVFDLTIDTTAPDAPIVDLSDNSDTYLLNFGFAIGDKTDNKTLDKQLEFDGQLTAADAGSVIVFYAYATQASINLGTIADTGEPRELLDGQDSSVVYSANDRFVLGTAVVGADGKYVMRMEDTDGSPLLSSQNAIYNGSEVDQYYLHVNAVMTDLAGNESETSDDLEIIIDSKDASANTKDPLILDLNNDGIYTSTINTGIKFDHDGDGEQEHTGWVSASDGFLALDLNNDGLINNGSELFGNDTVLGESSDLAGDGFEALSQYDTDNNQLIDADDDIYDDLRVWVDQNQNGETDGGELKTLSELNIESISLQAKDIDNVDQGNSIIKLGSFVQNGEVKDIVDADLALGPNGDTVSFLEVLVGDVKVDPSLLKVKVTLPSSIINGDYLVVTINGPTGVHSISHQVVAVDSQQGYAFVSVPNDVIETEGEIVSGEYSLSLIANSDSGSSVVLTENVKYQIDDENTDVSAVLVSSDIDSLENDSLDGIQSLNDEDEPGLEKIINVSDDQTVANPLISFLNDDLPMDLVDLDTKQSLVVEDESVETAELLSSLDLFENVNESDSLEQYFQFEQDGADLKVFVNESGEFNGQDNIHETATDVYIVQNFSLGDSVYEDVINKIMENKVEIDS